MSEEEVQLEAVRLLDIIAAEFTSDPMSVQCFDLRVVQQAQNVSKEARTLGILDKAWDAHG